MSKIEQEQKRGEVIIYKTKDGKISLNVKLQQESVWLTQKQIGLLLNKNVKTINEHIKNIFKEQELDSLSTIRKSRIVQKEGSRSIEREVDFYNLDVIISVGYRVKSKEGTQFRIWATQVLRKHLIDGYTINEQRLRRQKDKFKSLQFAVRSLKIS